MRKKLTDKNSISAVLAELTLDEKLNLVGEYSACRTLAIPDMDIPSLCLMDGVTGVNGTQGLLDYITSPERAGSQEEVQKLYRMIPELMELNYMDIPKAREKYHDNPHVLGLIDQFDRMRPQGKAPVSFPSGINIGASFDLENARRVGEALGYEMRGRGVDITMGPNVDISRDPLGGRGYEMYGEDPYLVERCSVAFIKGVQSTGTAACAKHYLANNQETNRNSKNTHVSERTLREVYARGFKAAAQEAHVKSIMSAYNAINGEFTSYSRKLLTGWIREEWGYEGVICCDWGAVKEYKDKSLAAGMDLILCGPNDMSGCRESLEAGQLDREVLDKSVERILNLIVTLREERRNIPFDYDQEALLKAACQSIAEGSVLLKNDGNVLPLSSDKKPVFYGRRSKEMFECGTGSTAVITNLHSNVYDECCKRFKFTAFEQMDEADVVIYTAAAVGGENIDRSEMNIEKPDQEKIVSVLRSAKEKGKQTVVILNIAGPIDMCEWIDYADAILVVFVPGCMGGVASARLLAGEDYPGGKLPVTMPVRYEDTPSYPYFPGETKDVYYGEGIFVGYRFYEKKKVDVLFPFGYGLSYTDFGLSIQKTEFTRKAESEEQISIPVLVKNTGNRTGSEVVQIYAAEECPHILRPVKELVGFSKVILKPGESRLVNVEIREESLRYFDDNKGKWIMPVGKIKLYIGTSSAHIIGEASLQVNGTNEYVLSGDSTVGEILANPEAVKLVDAYTGGMLNPETNENIAFIVDTPLSELLGMALITRVPDAVKLNTMLQELYDKLGKL